LNRINSSLLKYLNKSRRVLFSRSPAYFPSSPAGPRSPGVAHIPDSLLPWSRVTPTAARLRRSHVLLAARPPPLARAHRTGPLPSLLAARHARAPFSLISPLCPSAKKPPSAVTFLPPSSTLDSSHRSPHTTFATFPRR
jgi:hypothetical protein